MSAPQRPRTEGGAWGSYCDYLDRLERQVQALTLLAESVIEVHEHVVMDTPEDRNLHDRAVAQFRESLALVLGMAS